MKVQGVSLLLLIFLITGSLWAQEETDMKEVSYSIGVLVANQLKSQGLNELDEASFSKAMNDVLTGKELEVDPAKAQAVFAEYMTSLKQKQYEPIIAEGKKFLEENGKREGVVTLPSGLQYEVLVPGKEGGAKPGPTDKVKTHYHGTLLDGTVFDSSVQRGEPISFPVNGVIQGWQEALQLMPEGAKWKLFVPYNLAYGNQGAGPKIGPYSTLVFEVELLAIEK